MQRGRERERRGGDREERNDATEKESDCLARLLSKERHCDKICPNGQTAHRGTLHKKRPGTDVIRRQSGWLTWEVQTAFRWQNRHFGQKRKGRPGKHECLWERERGREMATDWLGHASQRKRFAGARLGWRRMARMSDLNRRLSARGEESSQGRGRGGGLGGGGRGTTEVATLGDFQFRWLSVMAARASKPTWVFSSCL